MKNPMISTIPISILLLLSFHLQAQDNQATIIELRDDNIPSVITAVIALISSSDAVAKIPTASELDRFLATPFENPSASYDADACEIAGVRFFKEAGYYSLRFDSLAGTSGKLLFLGVMDFGKFTTETTFSVRGPEVYNGIDYPEGSLQYQIFLVGTQCSDCASSSTNRCYGKMELVIIDKNIL